jgi:hypothetical protein
MSGSLVVIERVSEGETKKRKVHIAKVFFRVVSIFWFSPFLLPCCVLRIAWDGADARW